MEARLRTLSAPLLVLVMVGCSQAVGGSPTPPADPIAPAPPATPSTTAPATATPAAGSPLPVSSDAQIDDAWWAWDAAAGQVLQLTFDPGTWQLAQGSPPGSPLHAGTYTLAEGVLTWQEGWFDCDVGAMGSYEVLLSPDAGQLSFMLVGDECAARMDAFSAMRTWQRGAPPS